MSVRTRRVVTGHDPDGRSVVLQDGVVPHVTAVPGARIDHVWATSRAVETLSCGRAAEPVALYESVTPAPGAAIIRMIDFAPASRGGLPSPRHRSKTVDYGIVIEGEVTLLLEDNAVTLKAGDVVVQRGTLHAWENRTAKRARLAVVAADAEFDAELDRALSTGGASR